MEVNITKFYIATPNVSHLILLQVMEMEIPPNTGGSPISSFSMFHFALLSDYDASAGRATTRVYYTLEGMQRLPSTNSPHFLSPSLVTAPASGLLLSFACFLVQKCTNLVRHTWQDCQFSLVFVYRLKTDMMDLFASSIDPQGCQLVLRYLKRLQYNFLSPKSDPLLVEILPAYRGTFLP